MFGGLPFPVVGGHPCLVPPRAQTRARTAQARATPDEQYVFGREGPWPGDGRLVKECSQRRRANQEGTATYHARLLQTNNRTCLTCRFPLMLEMQISTASAYRPALAEHNERTDSVGRTRSEFHRRIHTVLWMHAAVWSTASAARRMERVSARGRSLYLYG